MPHTWDAIVVGVGGVGSAALYHLARRGARVLGLEQHGLVHDQGSSHGETRVIRQAYFEHPDYVPLARRAVAHWRDLEAASSTTLFEACGVLFAGRIDSAAVAGTIQAAETHGLPLERLTPREATARFPGFRFRDHDAVVFEREAGYLHVERCVRAHAELARKAGAEIRTHETVWKWEVNDAGIRVWTGKDVLHARSLVVAAGPWADRLLRELAIPLRVLRKVQIWFRQSQAGHREGPCFLFERDDRAFYGFPSLDGLTVKVAEHSGGETVDDPSLVDRRLFPADVAPLQQFLAESLPGVGPEPLRHSVCLYTMSPDGHFLLGPHPAHPQVSFAAGLSGHGFKFTPVLGEALADWATEGTASLPVQFLGPERFAGQ
jgi:sarcosine oxidase